MRFMYVVTSSQPMRGPTPALMEAMHKLSEREIKAGRMLDSGGLMPVSMGAQVKITDGKLGVVDGPFVETKEMIGGYAIFELRDKEEPLAEDLTQEALLAAIEHWPVTGVPEKPGAWLMATAKRRALDHLRRGQMLARKHEIIARDMEQEQQVMPDFDAALDDDIGDELL